MINIPKLIINKIFFIFFSSLLLIGQEPKPIKAGVAPTNYDYQGNLDAIHYSIEIGLGKETDLIEAVVSIRSVLKKDSPIIPVDEKAYIIAFEAV